MPPRDRLIDSRKHWHLPAVDPALALKYWHDGLGSGEIAAKLGVHESIVYNFLSRCREEKFLVKRTYVPQETEKADAACLFQGDAGVANSEVVPGIRGNKAD